MTKIIAFLTSRLFIFGTSVLLQLYVLFMVVLHLGKNDIYIYALFYVLSLLTILNIVSKRDNPMYKLAWVVPVALFPLLGWYIYFLVDRKRIYKTRIKRIEYVNKKTNKLTKHNEIVQDIEVDDPCINKQISYIKNVTHFPLYNCTKSEYLCTGETYFERLCIELNKAEKFIFMEYFIIEEGIMWNTILDILIKKASSGVEVKLIYDDIGCIRTLPKNYDKFLRKQGIQVHVFNVFTPSFDIFVNYRDHRKITVIDGNIGFTGGCNLADEYINQRERFGIWHDAGIIIKGNAVWSLSVLFLQMWQYYQVDDLDYSNYLPSPLPKSEKTANLGYIMPYGDGPLDDHLTGENIYINIINSAKKYVSITTPYLIIDNEMITALRICALSGVQVSIITPSIPDKWYVHLISQYNYVTLIEAGVEIYEFKDGFIHSKTMACDDEVAVVGTQNFDFRSFYLHYECGMYLYKTESILDVRADHVKCMKEGNRISLEDCEKGFFTKSLQSLLNIFAPMM